MKGFKCALLIGSAFAAQAMLGARAQAQDVAPVSADRDPAAVEETDEALDNSILVTAQFRAQSIQDTPLAITALAGDALENRGVTDVALAANLAPNVTLSKGAGVGGSFGQFATAFIRGIGQSDIHFAVEPGVGMYLDDAYYGVMSGAVFQLMDIDRIEVLRGPQGTLAGKNSIGGAIKIFSVTPDDDTDGFVELGYGSRQLISGRAASNITLIDDRLFARISVAGRKRDGYVDRLDYACATGNFASGTQRLREDCKIGSQGGEEVWSGRLSLRWLPTDNIENTLILDAVADRSENSPVKLVLQGANWAGTANYLTGPKEYTNYENYVVRPTGPLSSPTSYVLPSHSPLDGKGVTNTLEVDLSDTLSLTSITSYRTSDVRLAATRDAALASLTDQYWRLYHKQFTQELRLAGEVNGFLEWTTGLFYYKADGVSEGRVTLPGARLVGGGGGANLDTIFRDPVDTESKSAFVHTVWHPVPELDLIAAARYTEDEKNFTFNRYNYLGQPHPALLTLVDSTGTFKGDRVDYRLGASYRWTDEFMTYAQYSTGFKGGGVNPRPFFASQVIPFEPETQDAYEAGFKAQAFGRMLTINAAAFLNKFNDVQGQVSRCDDISPFPNAPCSAIRNVGNAEIKGAEAEVALRPVSGLLLNASLGYLDFEYTSANTLAGITLDMKPAYVPKYTAAAGIEYEIPVSGVGYLTPRLDFTYRSSVETRAINLPGTALPELDLWNASLRWESSDEVWSAILQVSNLTDKFYYQSQNIDLAPDFAGIGRVGPPREWSLSLKRTF